MVRLVLVLTLMAVATLAAHAQRPLVVGSKPFTESVILGEMIRQALLLKTGEPVRHQRELGGTRILFDAMRAGEVDIYPEYSGTLLFEVYAGEDLQSLADLRERMAADGLGLSAPLGFNNTYAIAMRRDRAEDLGLDTISDLQGFKNLSFGLSSEFVDRADGWDALRRAYDLPQRRVQGLQHNLAYSGIESGAIDVMDVYSTDAEITAYDLKVLEDERGHFPRYDALLVYRLDALARVPALQQVIEGLAGSITADQMRAMNAAVTIDGGREAAVAARFLNSELGMAGVAEDPATLLDRVLRRTGEHLWLVAVSLSTALLVAVPLGVIAYRYTSVGRISLQLVGMLQTIPSLAMLVFMIPLLGIGVWPTIAALFLYSLLPILRNTHAGLAGIDPVLRESALAMGLSFAARLRLVELPLALPTILAGVKTAAVINIGTATLGALIGAGGYGQPILTGIRLNNMATILEGAVPAAVLALIATALFDLAERGVVPRGMRLTRGRA